MMHFFRDVLDGWLYVVIAILAFVFILAIVGFIMERLQLEKEKKNREMVANVGEEPIKDVYNDVQPVNIDTSLTNENYVVPEPTSYTEPVTQYSEFPQMNEWANPIPDIVSNPYVETNNVYGANTNHYVASTDKMNSDMSFSEVKEDNAVTNADIPSVLDLDGNSDDLI